MSIEELRESEEVGEVLEIDDERIADRFSHKQRLAIELLGRGDLKNSEIAKAVGVSYNTLLRWGKDTDFQNEVALYESRRGSEAREKMMAKLDAAEAESIDVLIDIMRNSTKDSDKLKAALALIDTKKKLNGDVTRSIEVNFQGMPAPVMPVHEIHRGNT